MVGCHPLTLEAQVQFQASSRGIFGGKVTLEHVCLQVLQFHSTALSVPFHWCSILILACHWCYIISTTLLNYTLKSCIISLCEWWHVINVHYEAPYILSRITVAIDESLLKSVRLDITVTCSQKSLSCMFELAEGWDIRESGLVLCTVLRECVWQMALIVSGLNKSVGSCVQFRYWPEYWLCLQRLLWSSSDHADAGLVFLSVPYMPIIQSFCDVYSVSLTLIKQTTHKTYLLCTSYSVIQIKRPSVYTIVWRKPSCL
jgi:hypothetical protein